MKPWAFLFFSAVCKVLAQGSRPGDGLVVVGFDITDIAITYHSVRWEPLCGTVTYVGPTLDRGTSCVPAINQYTNYTGSTLAFYDFAGVKLSNTGVGLGTDLCLCFSMSTVTDSAYDICWAYNAIGQFVTESHGWQIGSFRSGAIKSLLQCGNVNVDALQAAWSRTAVMPQATGTAQTLDPGPSAIDHTVTQLQTLTLTPTLVNLTISSSAVVTGPDGQLTTEDRSYTTTAAVINFEPTPQQGLTPGDKIALGIGLGLGLPTLVLGILGYCYNRRQRAAASTRSAGNGVVNRRLLQYDVNA